jgi:hypothetical protein
MSVMLVTFVVFVVVMMMVVLQLHEVYCASMGKT